MFLKDYNRVREMICETLERFREAAESKSECRTLAALGKLLSTLPAHAGGIKNNAIVWFSLGAFPCLVMVNSYSGCVFSRPYFMP